MSALKRIWSIGFARITSEEQAEKSARSCACAYGILFFVIIVLEAIDAKAKSDLLLIAISIAIYVLIIAGLYTKSRGVALLCLLSAIWTPLDTGLISHGDLLHLAGMGIVIYIAARAVYATFKFHQLQRRQIDA